MSEVLRFLEACRDEEMREAFRGEFARLDGGDWPGLAEVVRALGFDVSPDELVAELPDGFFDELDQSETHRFAEALADDAFRTTFVRRFLRLKEGDWRGLSDLVTDLGFEVTAEELRAAMPASFYKGAGDHPHLGWDPSVSSERAETE